MRPIVRSTCSDASGWKLMIAAPAFAKSRDDAIDRLHHQMDVDRHAACGLIAAHTSGPTVRLGT